MNNSDFRITLNLDNTRIKNKEEAKAKAGQITNTCRNPSAIKTITPEQLIQAIEQGQTFTPAIMEGSSGNTWKAQQIICADIDNEEEITAEDGSKSKRRLANPLTPPLALLIMHKYGLTPYFMYYTFSSRPEHQKFRIVLILDKPITNRSEAEELGRRFTAIFNHAINKCADTSVNESARMLFGGKEGSAFNIEKSITPLEILRKLPQEIKPTPSQVVKEYKPNTAKQTFSNYEEENRRFDYDKKHFALADYIEATTNSQRTESASTISFNPCPVCTHEDDFKIKKTTPYKFRCFGANGDIGGTIIDYLMVVNNWELSQAIKFFKYDIMNYERPENPQKETPSDEQTERKKILPFYSVTDYLKAGTFTKDIEYFKQYKDRKTGFEDIDEHLTLYPGLAALGGASSLGKTTFIVNLIDNLLSRGETIIYFSLEQLPIEIITKSLTRALYEKHPDTLLTNIDIKNGATCPELEAIKKEYGSQHKKYIIVPANFRTTAQDIVNAVEAFRTENGGANCKPIVIIDYLQLIAPPEGFRGETRALMDENIKILKDFQKRNELFVIFVSSFNRDSNLKPVSYESFKETSMIEYTCDYVWGLQLQIQDADNSKFYREIGKDGQPLKTERKDWDKRRLIKDAQSERPKKIQFVSLKSRNGKQFYSANFEYYPQYDYFVKDRNPVIKAEGKYFLPFGGSYEDIE